MHDMRPAGIGLRLYLVVVTVLRPLVPMLLRKRLKRGKEHPTRWREKLGLTDRVRPKGRLVWLHAVGLGEVMALRGVIAQLSKRDPSLSFLVTSSTKQSALVFEDNLPDKTIHQFLPIDVPAYVNRFLMHWSPNLLIWSEQDLWPAMGFYADEQSVPQVLINARMNDAAFSERRLVKNIYRDIYRRFQFISAQDDRTRHNICALGAVDDVRVDGSIKPLPAAFQTDIKDAAALRSSIGSRMVWLVCPSHPADEQVAFAAHRDILETDPTAILVIIPRNVDRGAAIAHAAQHWQFSVNRRGLGQGIDTSTQVFVADTYGEAGFWYKTAKCALIGGGFDAIEGHNPWEAVHLNCPAFHGPNFANFERDYHILDQTGGTIMVRDKDELVGAITAIDVIKMRRGQGQAVDLLMPSLDKLCSDLIALIE